MTSKTCVFHKALRLPLVSLLVCLACFAHRVGAIEATNLIPNPGFEGSQDTIGLPEGWHRGSDKIPGVEPSRVYFSRGAGYPGKLLAMEGGPDRNGRVWCRIKNIRPHTDYRLEFTGYRPKFINGVY